MLLIALTLTAAQLPPEPMRVELARDPINDRMRASAVLREGGNRLVVSCITGDEDGPRITYHSRRWLARGHLLSGKRRLTYRFDDHRPRRMFWDVENRRATLTRDRRVATFLRDLATSQRLVIRARDTEGRLFDAIFHLNNAGPAVDQALRTCSEASSDS